MKHSRLLLILAAALLGAGCKFGSSGQADKKEESPKTAPASPSSAGSGTPQALPESGQQLSAMAVGPSAADSPDGEALAQLGRADFDGDGRILDGLNAFGAAPAVYAGSTSGARRLNYLLSPPRKLKVAASAVPSPVPSDGASSSRKPGAVLAAFEALQKAAYDAVYPVLSRLDWGAKASRGASEDQTPYRITVHHTDGPLSTDRAESIQQLRNIQHYHQKGHGWADIGYHFVIDGAGRVFEGRPVGILGAHAQDANAGNIGIALMGNFEKQRPTAQQVESLTRLSSYLAALYDIDPARRFDGHRHFGDTDCPGRYLVEILASLRTNIGERRRELVRRASPTRQAAADFLPLVVTDNG